MSISDNPLRYFHDHDYLAGFERAHCLHCGRLMVETNIPGDTHCRLVCQACGFVFYQNPKIVVGTIPVVDGKIVLVRRGIEPRKGTWSYPGGFMELGETVEEGALRETKEETNLDVVIDGSPNVYSRPSAGVVAIVFFAKVIAGQPTLCEEVSAIEFFEPREIPWADLAFQTTEAALRDWIATRGVRVP